MDKTGWVGREVTGLISKSGWISTEGNGIQKAGWIGPPSEDEECEFPQTVL